MTSGTPKYMGPEQWSSKRGKIENPFLCDVYSLGVILFHLVFKEYPFNPNPFEDQNSRDEYFIDKFIVSERNKHKVQISKELVCLLKGMLHFNPKNRISLCEVLNSPWFLL
jgi:serine/threonine protein kinase